MLEYETPSNCTEVDYKNEYYSLREEVERLTNENKEVNCLLLH